MRIALHLEFCSTSLRILSLLHGEELLLGCEVYEIRDSLIQ